MRAASAEEAERYSEEVRPGQSEDEDASSRESNAAGDPTVSCRFCGRMGARKRSLRRAAGRAEDSPPQIQAHLQGRRNRHHAPPVPLRRKRIPAERQALPPARHSGHLHGHRARPGVVRHHRAGTHRADPQQQADRPPRHHRRGRRHHEVQDAQAAGRGAAGRCQAEPGAHQRHLRRSHAPDEFAEAPGIEGRALCQAARRDARQAARSCWPASSRSSMPKRHRSTSNSTEVAEELTRQGRSRPADGSRARRAHPARLRHRARVAGESREAEHAWRWSSIAPPRAAAPTKSAAPNSMPAPPERKPRSPTPKSSWRACSRNWKRTAPRWSRPTPMLPTRSRSCSSGSRKLRPPRRC